MSLCNVCFALPVLVCIGVGGANAQSSVPSPQSVPIPPTAAFGYAPEPGGPALDGPLGLEGIAESAVPDCEGVDTVYFATNRDPIPFVSRPERFGNEVSRTTLFGRVTLDGATCAIVPSGIEVEVGNVSLALSDPFNFALSTSLNEEGFAGPLGFEPNAPLVEFAREAALPQRDVMVFVHGASHTFDTAMASAARLAKAYAREGVEILPLVFAYPTNGRTTPLSYFSDRRDAGMSGVAMAEAFEKLVGYLATVRFDRQGRTVLIAHSLGVYAAREGIQAVAMRASGEPVFDVAMLMAGDEDADSLSDRGKMRPLLSIANEVVVYFAENDLLMAISTLGNFRVPIGRRGPQDVSEADYRDVPVSAIDAEDFSEIGDRTRHRYHLRSPRVVEDAARVFAGEAADSIPGREAVAPRVYKLQSQP